MCGVVADLFRVDVDTAPLIEVALGENAQQVVLSHGDRLLDHMQKHAKSPPGRVALLRLDARIAASAVDRIDLTNEPGVLGRADAFVETAPQWENYDKSLEVLIGMGEELLEESSGSH